MKIAFFSNFLNDHQLPLCNAFLNMPDIEFLFVAFEPIMDERLALGFEDMNQLPFVVRAYEDDVQFERIMKICLESDILILGSAPEKYINERMKKNLLTFRYSERIYKKGLNHRFSPRAMLRVYRYHYRFRKKPLYLLCSSAFTAMDFARSGVYKNKAYKWGYFPKVKAYKDIDLLISNKKKNSLLWVGRLIDWKHPELSIEVAKKLKSEGIDFELNILGNGCMENDLAKLIKKYGLETQVKMLGAVPPEKVREYMENSEIFLFTSNRREGWGAVLNESLNSGCAVVASHAIGAVPFLLNDGENGFIYRDGNIEDLYNKVKFLLENREKRNEIGIKAYETLTKEWNANNAAAKLITLAKEILNGNETNDLFYEGVCSKAFLLEDDWYTSD